MTEFLELLAVELVKLEEKNSTGIIYDYSLDINFFFDSELERMNKDVNILVYSLIFGNQHILNSHDEALLLGFFVGVLHSYKIEYDEVNLQKVGFLNLNET